MAYEPLFKNDVQLPTVNDIGRRDLPLEIRVLYHLYKRKDKITIGEIVTYCNASNARAHEAVNKGINKGFIVMERTLSKWGAGRGNRKDRRLKYRITPKGIEKIEVVLEILV